MNVKYNDTKEVCRY